VKIALRALSLRYRNRYGRGGYEDQMQARPTFDIGLDPQLAHLGQSGAHKKWLVSRVKRIHRCYPAHRRF
jgi:hypothetical protein